jgi:hypothetical protein
LQQNLESEANAWSRVSYKTFFCTVREQTMINCHWRKLDYQLNLTSVWWNPTYYIPNVPCQAWWDMQWRDRIVTKHIHCLPTWTSIDSPDSTAFYFSPLVKCKESF